MNRYWMRQKSSRKKLFYKGSLQGEESRLSEAMHNTYQLKLIIPGYPVIFIVIIAY